MQGGELMDDRNNDFDFDFMPIGQAIKRARTAQGMTREQLSRIVDYDPRHLQAIENEGQYPSLELFIQLVTIFDAQLDKLDDKELSVTFHWLFAFVLHNFNHFVR